MSMSDSPSAAFKVAASTICQAAMSAKGSDRIFLSQPDTVPKLINRLLEAMHNLKAGRIAVAGTDEFWPSVVESEIHFAVLLIVHVAEKQGASFLQEPEQAAQVLKRLSLYFATIRFATDESSGKGNRAWLEDRLPRVYGEEKLITQKALDDLPKLQPYEVRQSSDVFLAMWGKEAVDLEAAPPKPKPAPQPRLSVLKVENGARVRSQDGRWFTFIGATGADPGEPWNWNPINPPREYRKDGRQDHLIDSWLLGPEKADQYQNEPHQRQRDANAISGAYDSGVKKTEVTA